MSRLAKEARHLRDAAEKIDGIRQRLWDSGENPPGVDRGLAQVSERVEELATQLEQRAKQK